MMQKEDPSNPDFQIDPVMKELWKNKEYGQYGTKKGELVVNFLTNNDITGGNSGSPCVNAKGELIGLAFDGNWEAMSGDIYFEPNIQRTIVCDIRFVMWIIDKCYGAQNLIDEMDIKKDPNATDEDEAPVVAPAVVAQQEVVTLNPEKNTAAAFTVDDIHFGLGKAQLSKENKEIVTKAAKILKDNNKLIVELEGHTDKTGDMCKNLALSEKRAKNVRKSLIKAGVPETRIVIKGFGSAQPKANNETEENRAKNRRVSFIFK
jgi:outer membrane protein OmpA-like peptidoglycan-associated protein